MRRAWCRQHSCPSTTLEVRGVAAATYASLLLAAGTPITYVSAQLGHANPATTLRYYAKWIPSKGQRWVEVLDTGPTYAPRPILEPKSGTSRVPR